MEDECYRIVAMKQLRKSIDPKSVAADHVPDIVSFWNEYNLYSFYTYKIGGPYLIPIQP